MQVSAKLVDASRTIKASFFFGVKEIPNTPDVGSKVRLIGTHLQQWKQGSSVREAKRKAVKVRSARVETRL